jgi:hypothetical protein
MIDQIAHKIGLKLDGSGCIYDMYADWSSADILRVPRKYDWETIYSSFVDLYIITNHTRQSELQYALLLEFQKTNIVDTNHMPSFGVVLKAMRHLPIHDPLCRWVVILYAFVWGSEDEGDYNEFYKDHKNVDMTALVKLLYRICRIRCPFTPWYDDAMLRQ